MPPFLSAFRSRTNSLLDTITGIIPDSPSDGTFKDNSLTCRKCGNRFRDRLELSSHFNLLPHHSDYSDSHNYDSFTRPKSRRVKSSRALDLDALNPSEPRESLQPSTSFSETQAYYAVQGDDKEQDSQNARPALLRKFPTLSSLSNTATGDQSTQSPSPTDYADSVARSPRSNAKGKGKQRAMPRLRRDDSFQYGLPLASSDEDVESQPRITSSSIKPSPSSIRSRSHSASTEAMTSHLSLNTRTRSRTSSITSRSSRALAEEAVGQAPPLPPKLPMFEWQEKLNQSRISVSGSAEDTASISSDASFRTAGSTDKTSEKSRLKQTYAARDAAQPSWGSPSTSRNCYEKELPVRPRARHASESNLLLESMSTSHDDAPPSYHELHGDRDPFEDFAFPSSLTSRHVVSRSDGFATVPVSPVSHVHLGALGRPRRSTNAWPFASSTTFPVTFSPSEDSDALGAHTTLSNPEDDLYNSSPSSTKRQMRNVTDARPSNILKSTAATLPPLVSSSSFSSIPSPSTPKTPSAFFADAPLSSPSTILPQPEKHHKASAGASRRSRQSSRAKSDAAAPSTRCPTCFVKFASLDKTLEHLDNSDCGAVKFESGIM